MSVELLRLSAVEVGRLIASREVSPVEVTRALNPTVAAYISFREGEVLAEAREAEDEIAAGRWRGPLHGVPVALKDSIFVAGEVTTLGSAIHRDFRAPHDAAVVEKLRAAGAVLTGKLNMHEYAWGLTNDNPYFGVTRNPWDPDRMTGGSSGGSAAAVAADLAFLTLGADAAGSIRVPSALCGGVGLKPTFGRVSTHGDFPLAWTLGHVGPMAKTVADAAAALQAIVGHDPRDPGSADRPVPDFSAGLEHGADGLVIGVEEDFFHHRLDHRIRDLVGGMLDALAARGARLQTVELPTLVWSEWAGMMTSLAEASTVHHRTLLERGDEYGRDVRGQLHLGETVAAVDYLRAQQLRRRLTREFRAAFGEVDVLLTPTVPVTTPEIGAGSVEVNGRRVGLGTNFIRYCMPANLTGHPALIVPVGVVDGMPAGLQIIGGAFDEAIVLRVGRAVEATDPLGGRRPVLGA